MWWNWADKRQKRERASRYLLLPSFLQLTVPRHNGSSILSGDSSRGQVKGQSFLGDVVTWPCTSLYWFSLFFFLPHSWFLGCAAYLKKALACQRHLRFSFPAELCSNNWYKQWVPKADTQHAVLTMVSHLEEVWWSNLFGMWNITNANYFMCI